MLIAGWGTGAKIIGCAGLFRCGNCDNVSLINIVEVKKKVSLYFVPVAKWGAQWYLVCTLCENATALDEEHKNEMLRASVDVPPAEVITAIWSTFDEAAEKAVLEHGSSVEAIGDALRDSIENSDRIVRRKFPDQYCDYVRDRFVEELLQRFKSAE